MMQMPQPNGQYHPELEHYRQWLISNRAVGLSYDGEQVYFVPLGTTQKYFKKSSHCEQLVTAVTKRKIPHKTVRDYFPNAFTILLLIGKGELIEHFLTSNDLTDIKLPLPSQKPDILACLDSASFQNFQAAQWQFCAPLFNDQLLSCPRYSPDYILPITSKRKVAEGGSAIVYEIGVHVDHDRLKKRDTGSSPSNPTQRKYALKTYRGRDAETHFRRESEAFLRVQTSGAQSDIVGYYGGFIHGESYNVILEFADHRDLEYHFHNVRNPTAPEDIYHAWDALRRLLFAVMKLHGTDMADNGSHGFHQDLKPSNILVLSGGNSSPYQYRYKMGDLNTAHFSAPSLAEEHRAVSAHGSLAYAPPECHRSDLALDSTNLIVSQNVDIWSLGCIWLESAVWIVFGKEELDEFRKQRRAEAHQYGIDGEVFHKHDAVLDTVATMCHSLRECSQAEDVVTPQMVGVIASMLRVRAKERPDTTELKTIIESIMAIAKKTFGANRRRADHQNSNPQHQFPGTYALDYPVPPEKQTADHARAYGQPSNSYVPASGGMDYGNTTQTWLRGPGVGAPGAYYLPEDSGHLRTHALESHFANNNVPSADYNPTGYGSRYHDAPHVRSDQVPYVAPEYNTGGRQLSLEQKMQAMKLHGTQTNANASHIQLDKSSQYAQIPQRNNSRGQRSFYEQSGDRTNQGPSYSGPPPAAMPAFPFGAMPQSHHQWQPPTSPMQGLPHGNGHFAPQANSGFGYGSSHYASFHHDTVGQARGMRYPAPQTRPFSEQYQKKSMADVNPSRASLPPRRSDSRVSLSASAAHRAPQVHSSPETIHEDYHPEPGILSDYPLFPTINEVPPQQPLLPQGNSTREIPKCKLGQAKDYIRAKKDKKRGTLPYSYLLNDLDKRDHVFILDNSLTMNYYWDEVVEVSKTLAWFVKKHDRDGLELCTTVPDVEGVNRHSGITTSTEFGNIAGSLRRDRASDITDILGEILDDYGKKLMQEYRKRDRARYPGSFRPIKPMTIYIFTDAVWTLESDPENAILKIVDILHKNSQYGSQQLGIQFIQWGPRVSRFTERLERLDKLKSYRPDLFHQEFRDIVDHTHVEDDNIWKMLFGSINKEFDDD